MAIEEPKYAVSIHEGAYEVRDYRAAIAAEVSVTVDQTAAARKGFRLLAGYIFEGNKRRQSIAMTAPVAQERIGEKRRHDGSCDPNPVRRRMGRSIHYARRLFAKRLAPARFAVIRFFRAREQSKCRR